MSAELHVKTSNLNGVKLPLLTTGLHGSIVYLNPDSPGHYRLELDVWYTTHKNGMELDAASNSTGEDMILIQGDGAEENYSITATVNGRVALQYQGPFKGPVTGRCPRRFSLVWGLRGPSPECVVMEIPELLI